MKKNDLLINLENISFAYPGGTPILNNLDLKLYKKDKIGLIAPNGMGKTTLFHLIMGLLKPISGKIELFGKHVRDENDFFDIRSKIGLLFQDADDQLFCPTVIEDVAFGPLNQGKPKRESIDIAKRTLAFLGIDEFEERLTFKLSGGEKRLVSLASVLAMEPKILLLDEPTNALDEKSKNTIEKVLLEIDISFILVSHNLKFMDAITNGVYTMENGKVYQGGEIHSHPHIHPHPYTDHSH
mmetsp:Transcript_820/g.661  ORF Transcript_820/g.661 Transcript_820/m.661 type:complete len:240 (-) Transcript_820:147-866(-)